MLLWRLKYGQQSKINQVKRHSKNWETYKEKKNIRLYMHIGLDVAGTNVMEAMTVSIWKHFRENLRQSIRVDNSKNPLPFYSRDIGSMTCEPSGRAVLRS
jgi:hypothetical protein